MDLRFPVASGISLRISDEPVGRGEYATSVLPKGFLLFSGGSELTEEAVGFGFPVVKLGLQALFPGSKHLSVGQNGSNRSVQVDFMLNLFEKIHRTGYGNLESSLVYSLKNSFAALIRSFPPLRGFLTSLSSGLRRTLNLETVYEEAQIHAAIKLIHTFHEQTGRISTAVDLTGLPAGATEIIVMNEQGASNFDHYLDSSGVSLQGREIGLWDEVTADEASFLCTRQQVIFKLHQVNGARLFRGREWVGSRLVWAGFGYSFPPSINKFHYDLEIDKQA